MKTTFIALLLFVSASVYASEPSVRATSLEELKNAFNYTVLQAAPVALEAEPLKTSGDNDIIRMEPIVVSGTLARNLARDFEHKAMVDDANAYTFNNGGLLMTKRIGTFEVALGLWPSIETISAEYPGGGTTRLRVDFLHLRF